MDIKVALECFKNPMMWKVVSMWNEFKNKSKNYTSDFEDMTRVIFKIIYANNININLGGTRNNPGIETDYCSINGENVGFQSKYFESTINYNKVIDSLEKARSNYPDLDKIILFCNLNIKVSTKSLENEIKELKKSGVKLEVCANKDILDKIEYDPRLSYLKYKYFGKLNLSADFFKNHTISSIKSLGDRYNKNFHVHNVYFDEYIGTFLGFEYCEAHFINMIFDMKKNYNEIINNSKYELYVSENLGHEISVFFNKTSYSWRDVTVMKQIFTEYDIDINNVFQKLYDEEIDKDEKNYVKHIVSLLLDFRHISDLYINVTKSTLIIDGEAGTGKSHELANLSLKLFDEIEIEVLLILGQKFKFDRSPEEQFVGILGLNKEWDFETFLKYCDSMSAVNKKVVLIVDGLNECYRFEVWKEYIDNFIRKLKSFTNVKLILSFRTPYKDSILSQNTINDINTGEIGFINHNGFTDNYDEAIEKYFEYYCIDDKNTTQNSNFTKPLFLKFFCETYKDKKLNLDIYDYMFSYFQKKEIEMKNLHKMSTCETYFEKIFDVLGKFFIENNTNLISKELYHDKLCEIGVPYKLIEEFIYSNLFNTLDIDGNFSIYMNFEKCFDYICANYIINNIDKKRIKPYLKNKKISPGIFSTLSLLFYKKNNNEIIDFLPKNFMDENFYNAYIESINDRIPNQITADFLNKLSGLCKKNKKLYNIFFNKILKYSTNSNKLVSTHLNILLHSMSLTDRDKTWTLSINKNEFLMSKIESFDLSSDLNYFVDISILAWILTSTNRKLRDYTSKIITKILVNDLHQCSYLLEQFCEVDDLYVISRLYGCVYGAVLRSEVQFNQTVKQKLINIIIKNLNSNKNNNYYDVLLRDYAKNITMIMGGNFSLINKKIKNPFSKQKISKICKFKNNYNGYMQIFNSMHPNLHSDIFDGMYGDFGRYTFESALSGFKDLPLENIFIFALNFIIKKLKYDSELSDIDNDTSYDRYNHDIERIGKKYQWISFYHTLGLVTLFYKYEEAYPDFETKKYSGPWNPFVRDYDPSVFIKSNARLYTDISMYRKEYNNWNLGNKNWAYDVNETNKFISEIEFLDDESNSWISLSSIVSDKNTDNYNEPRQTIWKEINASFIKNEDKENVVNELKVNLFLDRNFKETAPHLTYSIFYGEYPFSEAFKCEIQNESNKLYKTTKLEKVTKKKPKLNIIDIDGIPIDNGLLKTYEENVPVKECVGDIIPSSYSYYWEEEYDFSKDDSVLKIQIPCKLLISHFNLVSKRDGVWSCNGTDVCVDFSLFKTSNISGLYIKKEYLEKFCEEQKLDIIWVSLGDKDYIENGKFHSRSIFSSFMYYVNNEIEEDNEVKLD